jgi:hypothetical protein
VSLCYRFATCEHSAACNIPRCRRRSLAASASALLLSAFPSIADIRRDDVYVSFVPIVLKKSFWGDERNFLESLMRFTRGDVRDHIDSSKIDHGPS